MHGAWRSGVIGPHKIMFRRAPKILSTALWYGVVWCGVVWYGMLWYGMVWYGMVWYGMVWYGMVRMARPDVAVLADEQKLLQESNLSALLVIM